MDEKRFPIALASAPAGLRAVYADADGSLIVDRVIFVSLERFKEADGFEYVTLRSWMADGRDGWAEAEDASNFVGLLHEGDDPETLRAAAVSVQEHIKAMRARVNGAVS